MKIEGSHQISSQLGIYVGTLQTFGTVSSGSSIQAALSQPFDITQATFQNSMNSGGMTLRGSPLTIATFLMKTAAAQVLTLTGGSFSSTTSFQTQTSCSIQFSLSASFAGTCSFDNNNAITFTSTVTSN